MEERLRKFSRLIDAGSFTKASRELRISQPALSTAIKKLERELHAQLIVRSKHSLKLTKAGRLAYDSAKELGVVSDNLSSRITELTGGKPNIAIGMTDSVAAALFGSAESVEELERHTKLSIVVNNSRYLADAIERDEVDVAFITDRPLNSGRTIIVEHVADEQLVVVCHRSILPHVTQSVSNGVVTQFISYDPMSATRRIVDKAFDEEGISLRPAYYSTSPSVILQLVLLEKGAAALPYLVVKDYLKRHKLTMVGVPQPIIIERSISIIRRRHKLMNAPLSVTINRVGDIFDSYRFELAKICSDMSSTDILI